jgi:hypothetical protein
MDRLSFRKQSQAVIDEHQIWTPDEVVIESGGYQGSLASYLEEDAENPMQIYPFKNRGRSKERRTVEASTWFEKKRVFFHPKLNPRKNPDTNTRSPVIAQITSFPFFKNDDLHDCVVQGILAINEIFPPKDQKRDIGFDGSEQVAIRMTSY